MFCGDWTSWEAWIASVLCNYSLRFIKKNLLSFTRLVHPTQLKRITFLPHNIQKRKWNVKVASKKNSQFSLNARPIWSILTIVFNPFAHGIFVKGTFSFKASGQVHFFWRNVSYKKKGRQANPAVLSQFYPRQKYRRLYHLAQTKLKSPKRCSS